MPLDLLNQVFLENPLRLWLVALLGSAAVVGLFYAVELIVVARLRKKVTATDNSYDDLAVNILDSTQFLLVLLVAVYAGSTALTFSNQNITLWLRTLALSAALLQAAVWGHRLLYFFIDRGVRRRAGEDDRTIQSSVNALTLVSRIALWSIVGILILDNIPNVQVTSLVTGLGIAGIAVGLAVQNILGDLLASLSIILDRPFVVGDFITIDEHSGTVRSVGLKTTRVRSIQGEELVFSNSDMLTSRIQNYGKMRIRRIQFFIRVVYDTPSESLQQIPQMLQEVIGSETEVRFDRAHFANFGDFGMEYEVVYFVLTDDYRVYRDKQQSINLDIVKRFEAEGIEFAYPAQVIRPGNTNTNIVVEGAPDLDVE